MRNRPIIPGVSEKVGHLSSVLESEPIWIFTSQLTVKILRNWSSFAEVVAKIKLAYYFFLRRGIYSACSPSLQPSVDFDDDDHCQDLRFLPVTLHWFLSVILHSSQTSTLRKTENDFYFCIYLLFFFVFFSFLRFVFVTCCALFKSKLYNILY